MTPRKGSLNFAHPPGSAIFTANATTTKTRAFLLLTLLSSFLVPSTVPTMDEDTIPDHISPQYTSVPLPVLQMCQELSEILMVDAFGKKPFPWQKAIITHLNLMTCPTSGIPPSPTFLCAPTGNSCTFLWFHLEQIGVVELPLALV
jgi:hypothetical protein